MHLAALYKAPPFPGIPTALANHHICILPLSTGMGGTSSQALAELLFEIFAQVIAPNKQLQVHQSQVYEYLPPGKMS